MPEPGVKTTMAALSSLMSRKLGAWMVAAYALLTVLRTSADAWVEIAAVGALAAVTSVYVVAQAWEDSTRARTGTTQDPPP